MSALLSGFTPYLLAIGAALVGALMAYMRGRTDGARLERGKQVKARLEAIEEAAEVQNDIGAMPPDAAREALKKRWSLD